MNRYILINEIKTLVTKTIPIQVLQFQCLTYNSFQMTFFFF